MLRWAVWDADDESAPLRRTHDVDEAAGYARALALAGRKAYLASPDQDHVYWKDGQFHPRTEWDEVPEVLRRWQPADARPRRLRLVRPDEGGPASPEG